MFLTAFCGVCFGLLCCYVDSVVFRVMFAFCIGFGVLSLIGALKQVVCDCIGDWLVSVVGILFLLVVLLVFGSWLLVIYCWLLDSWWTCLGCFVGVITVLLLCLFCFGWFCW